MAGYGSDEGFAAWLTANGYSLPDGAPAPASLRERGSVTVDALYGGRFVGEPTGGVSQERAWPRTGAFAMGGAIPPDVVPVAVVSASYHAALASVPNSGASTSINAPQAIKRDRVGDAETEFADAAAPFQWSDDVPVSVLDGLLAPFLRSSFGFWIRSVG